MHADLIAEIASPEAFADASRGWLSGVMPTVFPELWAGLRTRPSVRDKPRPKQDLDLPWGPPGTVLGVLATYRTHQVFGGREVLFSDRSWLRFLAGLDAYPFTASVTVNELDARGFPVHEGWADVTVTRDQFSPEWVSFRFSAMSVDTGWPESRETQERWAEFVKDQAARIDAVAGSMTDDIGPGETALQRATFNYAAEIADSREVLRGYSWITIVAAGLAARLGGADALRATGAFHEVSVLPNGALWLRATPTINEFLGDRVRRVFEALAPVLPTGVATARYPSELPWRLMMDADAADYQ